MLRRASRFLAPDHDLAPDCLGWIANQVDQDHDHEQEQERTGVRLRD
jgi:hypothetical protein